MEDDNIKPSTAHSIADTNELDLMNHLNKSSYNKKL